MPAKCPICDAPVEPRSRNQAFPFCSPRCKTIDLGKWLNEEYRVPAAEGDEPDDDDGSPSGRDMRH